MIYESEHRQQNVSITMQVKRLSQSKKKPRTGTAEQKSLTLAATESRL
jgi:hypothetical protein